MLSKEQNDLITRIGPGTPAGTLMRRYWQPAALVDELAGNRPVKPVRLLGEHLVLFGQGAQLAMPGPRDRGHQAERHARADERVPYASRADIQMRFIDSLVQDHVCSRLA